MQRKARYQQSTAATLRFTPPEGRPITAATVALYTPAGAVLQASASATLPAVATTLSASVSAGVSAVAVASATGIVAGGWYWLGVADGTEQLEMVRVVKVATLAVTLSEDIQHDHVSGAAFTGTEITYSLTTTHTATLGRNYRAYWTYTVASTAYQATTVFDVALVPFRLLVTAQDLATRIPVDVRRTALEVLRTQDFVLEAEDMLLSDLERRRIRPDLVRNTGQLRSAAILAVQYLVLQRAAQTDQAWRQAATDAWDGYQRELAAALANVDWLDYQEENVAEYDETTGYNGVGDQVSPSAFGPAS